MFHIKTDLFILVFAAFFKFWFFHRDYYYYYYSCKD